MYLHHAMTQSLTLTAATLTAATLPALAGSLGRRTLGSR